MKPLYRISRGTAEEIVQFGHVTIVDDKRVLFATDSEVKFPARSLLKPFQFAATGLAISHDYTAVNRLVPALGSVSAEEWQVQQLLRWYQGSSLIQELKFSPGFPMDERYRVLLKERKEPASPLYHTCFSKHMAILESCRKHQWPTDSYLSTDHPYYTALHGTLSSLLENLSSPPDYVSDGCLLPTPVLSMSQMGFLFQRLVDPSYSKFHEIGFLMQRFPEWIGGKGRADTQLMQKNQHRVIAKEGADGLMGLGIAPTTRFPSGLGIIVKISAGYMPFANLLALKPIFDAIDISLTKPVPQGFQSLLPVLL